jgi:hypothetical protein
VRDHAQIDAAFDVERKLEMIPYAAKQQQRPRAVRGLSRIAMLNIRKHYFILSGSEPIIVCGDAAKVARK